MVREKLKMSKPLGTVGELRRQLADAQGTADEARQRADYMAGQLAAMNTRISKMTEDLTDTKGALSACTKVADGLRKDLEAERNNLTYLRNDLQRALGYIDRVNESEAPQTHIERQERTLLRGPQLNGVGLVSIGSNDCNQFGGSQQSRYRY